MSKERLVLIAIWSIGILAAGLFVRRSNWHRFAVSYLLCQNFTWVCVTLHVKFAIFTYPVREFPRATNTGFTVQYMLYPVLCGLYILFKPHGAGMIKTALYILPWTVGVTLFHYLLSQYTDLLRYNHGSPFLAWLMIMVIFGTAGVLEELFFKYSFIQAEGRLV